MGHFYATPTGVTPLKQRDRPGSTPNSYEGALLPEALGCHGNTAAGVVRPFQIHFWINSCISAPKSGADE